MTQIVKVNSPQNKPTKNNFKKFSHQALGSVDHSVIQCLGRDLIQGNDSVSPLQLSLFQ